MRRIDRLVILFALSMAGVFTGAGRASMLGFAAYAVMLVAVGSGSIIGLATLFIDICSRRPS